MSTCAATNIVFALVIVNRSEVLGAGDATWPLSCPRKAPSFANIAFICRCLRLRVQADVLVECVRLQRRNETLLLYTDLVLLHRTSSSVIHATRINTVDILEQVANHWLTQIRYSFIFHHVE